MAAVKENAILRDVLVAVSALPHTHCWRNNTGRLPDRNGRWVSFGVPGSGDVLGCHRGHAIAIETKRSKGGVQSDQQKLFERAWRNAGGVYILSTDADEVLAVLRGL